MRLQNIRDFRLPTHIFEGLTLLGCYAALICKLLDISGQPIGLLYEGQELVDGKDLDDETDRFGLFRPRILNR